MDLETERLRLRSLTRADHSALVEMLTDASLMKWALNERALSLAETEELFAAAFASADAVCGLHVITMKESTAPIGFGGLRECSLLGTLDVEFGWVIGSIHQRRGFATELGVAFINYVLRQLRLSRVLAACNPRNVPSEHVLRDKLGMMFVREVEPRPGFRRRVYAASSGHAGK